MKYCMLTVMLAVLMVLTSSVFAADARREAARLAAQRAEEATNRRRTGMAATSASSGASASGQAGVGSGASAPAAASGVVMVSGKDIALHGAGDLVGRRYLLQEIDGAAVAEDSSAAGSFVEWRSETSMTGKLCNIFHASCSFENTVVKGDQLPAMTKMACADEAMGKVEERFFAALRLGMSFVAIGDFLEMRRDDSVLRFAAEGEGEAEEEAASEEKSGADEEVAEGAAGAEDDADAEVESEVEAESEDEGLVSVVIAVAVTEADLIDRKFILSKVDGEDFVVTLGNQPFIEFGEGMRVGGNACNVFTGLGALVDGKLIVANAVATRKMCIDPKLSGFERDFHRMLRDGVEAAMEGGALVLRDGERRVEFVEEK